MYNQIKEFYKNAKCFLDGVFKKHLKLILVLLWGILYLIGVFFTPIASYNPSMLIACLFFLLGLFPILISCIYEYKTDKESKSPWKHIMRFLRYAIVSLATIVAAIIVQNR